MTIHPIVLAAGRSERMGRPKLLLDFDGKKAITLVVEACITSCLGAPVIVLGHEADRIKPELPPVGVNVVVNEHYNLGMTSSLKCGLEALPANTTAFIIFPADFPLVTGADLRALATAFVNRPSLEKRIFIPSVKSRGGHPVLVDAYLKPDFAALSEEKSAREVIFLTSDRIQHVEVANRGIFADLDVRKDYDEALREYRKAHTNVHKDAPKSPETVG